MQLTPVDEAETTVRGQAEGLVATPSTDAFMRRTYRKLSFAKARNGYS